jgi:hypothetical protein
LVRSGGGSIGGFSGGVQVPHSGGTKPAGATAPTASLTSSFFNQIDTTQLTSEQPQAACGPAAAAFFAKAYGRNPTLKEAYAIVSQVQGGDPAQTNGTRGVGTLGTALQMQGTRRVPGGNIYQ